MQPTHYIPTLESEYLHRELEICEDHHRLNGIIERFRPYLVTWQAEAQKEANVAEEMTRLYHGGVGPIEESRWFTSDRRYAEQYAAKSPGASVYYVDLPSNHPLIEPEWPDQSISRGFTWSGELPEELTRQAKPMIAEKEMAPEKSDYERMLDEAARRGSNESPERDGPER